MNVPPTRPLLLISLAVLLTLNACDKSESKTKTTPQAKTDAGVTEDTGQPVATSGVTFSSDAVRGCELVLTNDGATVDSVTFAETVKGSFVQEAPKTAITVVSKTSDATIPPGAVGLVVTGDVTNLKVTSVSCVGEDGKAIDGVKASLK